ncbi:MAG: type I DNA topoisomerase [Methanobacteriota archaeon]|nr:MAG: type I DNA topoisomerase [Euryarchaeota archaeon]
MNLLIVESNAKSKTIQKYLGKEYIVEACGGHVEDLPKSNNATWVNEDGELPKPPWSWTNGAQKIVNKMLKQASENNVETIYVATDPDREGEFIAWRLYAIFTKAGYHDIRRVTFNAITKKQVEESILNASEVNMNLVDAAIVRRLMDRLVGFKASKFANSWSVKSMGRVQTPTCGFIVDRELEREAFVPVPYYSAHTFASKLKFNVRFHDKDDEGAWRDSKGKFDSSKTDNRQIVDEVIAALETQRKIIIRNSKEGKRTTKPKPAFTTDTLLQAAGSYLGWGVGKTMVVAGALYNNGHITYLRTDSTRTDPGARNLARKFIEKIWGANHLGTAPGPGAGSAKDSDAQDAHEAIRPTNIELGSVEDSEQNKLYQLIKARFLATQMSEAKYSTLSLEARVEGFNRPLTSKVEWRVHDGWEAAFISTGRKQPLLERPKLDLMTGAKLRLDDVESNPIFIEDKTKPPARYRQPSLVAQMKKSGIGRPSTYASTIKKLLDRKYCESGNSGLEPTNSGRTCWLEVAPHFSDSDGELSFIFSAEFTADMENRLDLIENGEKPAHEVWDNFTVHFDKLHNIAQELKSSKPTPRQKALFDRLWNETDDLRKSELLQSLNLNNEDEISGEQMKGVLDKLTNETTLPASPAQLKFIRTLLTNFEGSESDAFSTVNTNNLEELTGGRTGTASKLIEFLLEKNNSSSPASPKQLKFIANLAEKAELNESQACAIVDLKTYSELVGGRNGSASKLINELKKITQNKKKSKKE